MRLWEFDRVGAMASSSFDINKDGLQFVSAMLGFLTMNDEQLGYDPSIISTSDEKKATLRFNAMDIASVLSLKG